MRARIGFALAALALGGAGCILFTGLTSGYSVEDAGSAAAGEIEGGVCIAEGGVCIDFQCHASSDCKADQVCCLGSGLTSSTAGAICQGGPCGFGSVQVCASSAECEGSVCTAQECPLGTNAFVFQTCGLVPGCIPVAAPLDAGVDALTAD